MLTLKQIPIAVIGMFTACFLAEGEPEAARLNLALVIVTLTVLYVLICNKVNTRKNEE